MRLLFVSRFLCDVDEIDFLIPEGFVAEEIFEFFQRVFHPPYFVDECQAVGVFCEQVLHVIDTVGEAFVENVHSFVKTLAGQIFDVRKCPDLLIAGRIELPIELPSVVPVGDAGGGEVLVDDFLHQPVVAVCEDASVVGAAQNDEPAATEELPQTPERADRIFQMMNDERGENNVESGDSGVLDECFHALFKVGRLHVRRVKRKVGLTIVCLGFFDAGGAAVDAE